MSAGGVTIDGDLDRDGKPDIAIGKAPAFTRTRCWGHEEGCGIEIGSSGNRLHGLTLVGFGVGVSIGDYWVSEVPPMPTRVTLADNVIEGLTIRDVREGVVVATPPYCAAVLGTVPEKVVIGSAPSTAATGIRSPRAFAFR